MTIYRSELNTVRLIASNTSEPKVPRGRTHPIVLLSREPVTLRP